MPACGRQQQKKELRKVTGEVGFEIEATTVFFVESEQL
jgi:hypothetical protein